MYGDHRDLHVLTHSFPTRRSSDLWFWASYVIHHSSQHYNLSTALRQTWTGFFSLTFLFRLQKRKVRLKKRSEEHTSEIQSLMRISYAVCYSKKKRYNITIT